MFFSYKDAMTFVPVTVKGIVLDEQTGSPVSGIYVYITKGKEEGCTDAHGVFSIKTCQPLPVPVTVLQGSGPVTKTITTLQKPVRISVRCS